MPKLIKYVRRLIFCFATLFIVQNVVQNTLRRVNDMELWTVKLEDFPTKYTRNFQI